MSYRILVLTTATQDFTIPFLKSIPNVLSLSFSELYSNFLKTKFGWSDFYSKHMGQLGNLGWDIISNIEPMQKAWAKENSVTYSEKGWHQEIALAQIRFFNPDIIYLPDLYTFDKELRSLIRKTCGSKTKIIGWRFAPTKDYSIFSDLDLLLTGNHDFINRFKQNGINAYYLPHGFEKSLLEEIDSVNNTRTIDSSFIGSTGAPIGIHSERYHLLLHLMKNSSMELWTNPEEGKFYNRLNLSLLNKATFFCYKNFLHKNKNTQKIAANIPFFKRGKYVFEESFASFKTLFPQRVHPPIYGIEAYKILSNSKVVFNKHIDVAGKSGGNVRLFEATGLGACLLTDDISNIKDFYEPDYEVVTYHSKEEALEKLKFLINNESVRRSIAFAGRKKTLSHHTIQNRVELLNDYCLTLLR
jgi:spore maturation protein CgeB